MLRIALVVILLLLLTGCAGNSYQPYQPIDGQTSALPDNTAVAQPVYPASTPKPISVPQAVKPPPDDQNWLKNAKISVGSFKWICPQGHQILSDKPRDWADCPECGVTYPVKLDDWQDKRYYAGAGVVEQPIIVHNGNDWVSQALQVTTEPNELVADIPIRYKAYGEAIDIIITSDNNKDNLSAVGISEDGKSLKIAGFSPDDTRVMTLKYQYYAPFSITYRTPDNAIEGYLKAPADIVKDWVVIADPTPLFAPRETKNIMISLDMPAEVTDDEAQFWNVTKIGTDRLGTVRLEELQKLTDKYVSEVQGEPDRDKRIQAEEQARFQAARDLPEHLNSVPEFRLFVFLDDNGSVSQKLVKNMGEMDDLRLLDDFVTRGYAVKGDLRKDKWEFWISVIDKSEEGMAITEICSRWLITMKTA